MLNIYFTQKLLYINNEIILKQILSYLPCEIGGIKDLLNEVTSHRYAVDQITNITWHNNI